MIDDFVQLNTHNPDDPDADLPDSLADATVPRTQPFRAPRNAAASARHAGRSWLGRERLPATSRAVGGEA